MLDRKSQTVRLKSQKHISPLGFNLEFKLEGNTARSEFVLAGNRFLGHSGCIHNGILAFLMDVAMGWMARHCAGVNSVTATLEIDYHQPARAGETLIIIAEITRNTRRLLEEKVRIQYSTGALIAEGTCLQFILGPNTHQPHPLPELRGTR
jgi:uncharacterized protein (TIGR00369 family)